MPESKLTKLTGQIVSIETGYSLGDYWIDLTLKLIEGHIVNVHYLFRRQSVRDNIVNTAEKGMMITVSVAGPVDLDGKFDYDGIGAIQIHDLSNELDRYVREKFRTTEEDYFTEREAVLINRLLTTAGDRIRETFKPSEEVMAKVEERLDSLERKTRAVTKYDWRKLFVSCVVSISMDLGFGVSIPEALYDLFKKLVEELLQHRLAAPEA